ncbi:hypothetical protein PTRA_b0346 [Pseudoalteromonas translucida KMM 520]|uniref:Uncharacterized protein n=1 Tax=Pseudoalteromonas translucida KMM 520 TaxID=1315283 RepID=A0A0U2X4H8_9GAMM|nr:hypothetical protein PTRA_b0346 [Pseudoalteromonas translucida KMM 520]
MAIVAVLSDNIIKSRSEVFKQGQFYYTRNYLFTLELFGGTIKLCNIRRFGGL